MSINHTICILIGKAYQILEHLVTPQLDAEMLLSHVLNKPREFLYTWPQHVLNDAQAFTFDELIQRRKQGEPIAYLTGHQEFWSLDFKVSPDVLVPRFDTELLVEQALQLTSKEKATLIADLGTGSGAIAIALASELPNATLIATDLSQAVLEVAKFNAKNIGVENIQFCHGHWLNALPNVQFDMIISNPPYISENDSCLQQDGVCFEPSLALVAGTDGLDAIRLIIAQSKEYLKNEGFLLLEHGYNQAKIVQQILSNFGFDQIETKVDLSGVERITIAKKR